MSLGSPRTTKTQEGLATFAELITSSIDLARLRRIALRIPAVHMGLESKLRAIAEAMAPLCLA